MPFVEFLRYYQVNDTEGREFQKGEIAELSYHSCQHFVTRDVARYVEGAAPVKVATKPKKKRARRTVARSSVSQPDPASTSETVTLSEDTGESSPSTMRMN